MVVEEAIKSLGRNRIMEEVRIEEDTLSLEVEEVAREEEDLDEEVEEEQEVVMLVLDGGGTWPEEDLEVVEVQGGEAIEEGLMVLEVAGVVMDSNMMNMVIIMTMMVIITMNIMNTVNTRRNMMK